MALAGAAGVVVLLVGGAAVLLDGQDARPSAPTAGGRASTASSTPSADATPPATAPAAAAQPSDAVLAATGNERTPADARAALEEQLAARADAVLALLRSTFEGDASAASRATAAVSASSTGLSAVVGTWGGTALADQVRSDLDRQSQASRAYAAAVAAGDVARAEAARADMGEVSRGLGDVLDEVTDGRIAAYVPPQDAAQYRAYVDALEAQDPAAAEAAAAWLRPRLVREGAALAAALTGGGPS